jgi:hypothetical protein
MIDNEEYIIQDFDPNYGVFSIFSTLYYTSRKNMLRKSNEGISIWFSEDYKIKIVKIIDWALGELIWYDDKKKIIIKQDNTTPSASLKNEIKVIRYKRGDQGIEIEKFYDHIKKIHDAETQNLILNIFTCPKKDYYLLPQMMNRKNNNG